jgi:hypothetical protein
MRSPCCRTKQNGHRVTDIDEKNTVPQILCRAAERKTKRNNNDNKIAIEGGRRGNKSTYIRRPSGGFLYLK